jgi:hypothetical protein
MSELKIGFVGLGDQGAPMAEAIADAGGSKKRCVQDQLSSTMAPAIQPRMNTSAHSSPNRGSSISMHPLVVGDKARSREC